MSAHVMDYNEILKVANNGGSIYEERRGHPGITELTFDGTDFSNDSGAYLMLMECDEEDCMDYNWNYRVWNEIPTNEQMMNTPWKSNPYKNERVI